MGGARLKGACAALFLAAAVVASAAAAEDTCPASWKHLPLATKPATLEQLDLPAGWQAYLKSSIIPHVIGPAVALVLALILLLTFLIWRLVKLCCACFCACARGPQRSGRKARKLLTGKRHRWVQGLGAAMAIGVLGGSIYGITRVQESLVEPGLASVDVAVAFIGQAVDAGQGTVDAAAALDAQLQGIKAQMEAMAALGGAPAAALLDPYISAIDGTHGALGTFSSFSTQLSDIKANTADMITARVAAVEPTALTADTWRARGLFIAFGVLAGLSVFLACAALLDWPAVAKPLTLALLVLALLSWILVLALTVVLRAGNDVCVNLEPKVLQLVGSSSLSLGGGAGGSASAQSLVNYYLTGEGGGVFEVINEAMGVDVQASLAQANTTLTDLQAAISTELALAPLAADFAVVLTRFGELAASIDTLGVALSYEAFHPVWSGLKGFVCCTALNSVGDTWEGLVVAGSFALLLLICAFFWIGRMDKLAQQACCHVYSARDYTLEGEQRRSSDGDSDPLGAALARKAGGDPLAAPGSPGAMARKASQAQASPSPRGSGGSIRANRVAPSPPETTSGGGAGYPAIQSPGGGYPAIDASAPSAANLDSIDAVAEAERAAALAGEAFQMAGKAQQMLDAVARSHSNRLMASPPAAAPAYPPPAVAAAAGMVGGTQSGWLAPHTSSPSSPPLSTQSSAIFVGPANVTISNITHSYAK